MFFSSERNLESVLEEQLKEVRSRRRETVYVFLFVFVFVFVFNFRYYIFILLGLIDVSGDIFCLHAEPRLHCFVYIYDLNLLYQCLN